MKQIIFVLCFIVTVSLYGQDRMTPEGLWQLGRVNVVGISRDGKQIVYTVTTFNIKENKSNTKRYSIPIEGGPAFELTDEVLVDDKSISPDGQYKISMRDVKIDKVQGKDFYPELDKSNVQIYDGLNYRHWDTWEDGAFGHLFVHPMVNGKPGEGKDIMTNEPYDCPLKPSGGKEDFTWRIDSKKVVYVAKKKAGTVYAVSTNTDLYEYDVINRTTLNLTEGMMGYDTEPSFSTTGALAWLSMKRDGYESDKNDIIVRNGNATINLTQQWDGTVDHFRWSPDGKKIYFIAPIGGTIQLFEVDYPGFT